MSLTSSTRRGQPTPSAARRALPITVGATVALLPFGDTSVPGAGVPLVYGAMVLPAAIGVLLVVRDEVRLPSSLVLLGSVLGLAGAVVSAAGGIAPDRSVPLVALSVVTMGYALAISLTVRLDGLVELLTAIGGVVAVMALLSSGSMQAAEAGTIVTGRPTGPFAQPNELGVFCAALLPLAVACAATGGTRRRNACFALAALALGSALLVTMSRGAWIGGAAGLLVLAVCAPTTRRALSAAGLAAAGLAAAAFATPAGVPVLGVLRARIRSLGSPSDNPYDDRPLTWAEAWRQATDNPWFGVGPGGFHSAAGSSTSTVSAAPADHPHNLVLTVLADRGVIGLAAAVVLAAGCVLALRRQLEPVPVSSIATRTRNVAVIAGLAAVLVHGLFDMPLRNPIVAGLVWTLLGIAAVIETARRTEGSTRRSDHRNRPRLAREQGRNQAC